MTFNSRNVAQSPLGLSRLVTPAARSLIRVDRAKGVLFFTGGLMVDASLAYQIRKDTGLAVTSIVRFVNGETSLRLDKADVLAEYLGLELTQRRPTR